VPLSRKQKWRINKVQSDKIARADKAASKIESQLQYDEIDYVGRVITRYGQRQLVEDENGDVFQSVSRQNIGFSVAGDKVLFQKTKHDDAIVTAIYPRENELKRQDKLIAANIDQLWLVVALEPHYEFELIDRYLIMAENSNLPIGIIVNKIELSNNEAVNNDFQHYKELGYEVHLLSVKEDTNLDNFKLQLVDKCKLGKHTTTNTTIYHIPSGGDLIDSPGVREFQLDSLTEIEIKNGFKEFKVLADKCRFRDCKHLNEPSCAVKESLDKRLINKNRYQSYLNLIL
jgi:ribosome biogenesis GTPase